MNERFNQLRQIHLREALHDHLSRETVELAITRVKQAPEVLRHLENPPVVDDISFEAVHRGEVDPVADAIFKIDPKATELLKLKASINSPEWYYLLSRMNDMGMNVFHFAHGPKGEAWDMNHLELPYLRAQIEQNMIALRKESAGLLVLANLLPTRSVLTEGILHIRHYDAKRYGGKEGIYTTAHLDRRPDLNPRLKIDDFHEAYTIADYPNGEALHAAMMRLIQADLLRSRNT